MLTRSFTRALTGTARTASFRAPLIAARHSRSYSEQKPAEEAAKEEAPAAEGAKEDATSTIDPKDEQIKDLKDKLLRSVADFRNLQDRTARDMKSAKDFAIQKFAKDLVESVDNFERALNTVPVEHRTDSARNKELVDLYSGLKMTEEVMMRTLERHGLVRFSGLEEKFDPNMHEALFEVPMPGKEPGSVFHCESQGFTLNGRCLRPAKVGIVKGDN
ncbi:GrpE, mitochondrial [Saitoella coloradoensis]